jgi:hypothetical protein
MSEWRPCFFTSFTANLPISGPCRRFRGSRQFRDDNVAKTLLAEIKGLVVTAEELATA